MAAIERRRVNRWHVLAFDVRVPMARANRDLLPGYRQHALLDPNVSLALSVDETIWSQIERDRMEELAQHAAVVMRSPCHPRSLLDSNGLISRILDQWHTDRSEIFEDDDWLIVLSIFAVTVDYFSSLKAK